MRVEQTGCGVAETALQVQGWASGFCRPQPDPWPSEGPRPLHPSAGSRFRMLTHHAQPSPWLPRRAKGFCAGWMLLGALCWHRPKTERASSTGTRCLLSRSPQRGGQIPLPRLSTPATSSSRPRSAGLALAVPQGFLMPAALGLPRPGASGIHSFESFQTLWALLFKPLFASQLLLSEFQMQIPRVYPRDSAAGGPGWAQDSPSSANPM